MEKFSLNNDMWTHPELKNIHWTDGVNNLINNHNDIILGIAWINECIGKIKQHQLSTYDLNKEVNFECLKDFTVWHLKNNHPLYYFIWCQEQANKPELFRNQLIKDNQFPDTILFCCNVYSFISPHRIMLPEEY